MRYTFMSLMLFFLSVTCHCQTSGYDRDILLLSGAESMEDLDEEVAERFDNLNRHPIRINSAPLGRLQSCGLFSRYQAASIADYRSRCGDIISIHELALVDGIGEKRAEALARFISLEKAGDRSAGEFSITTRANTRKDGEDSWEDCYGSKVHFDNGDGFELSWAGRTTYSRKTMTPGTLSTGVYGSRGKVVAGDFNARFGQGLGLWNGFSLSGFGTAAAFRRNGTGISTTSSYSGGFRGIGGDYGIGGWTMSAALSLPGLRERMDGSGGTIGAMPMLNISKLGRNYQAGATGWCELSGEAPAWSVSMDGKLGLGPVELFGEAAIQQNAVMGGIAGLLWAADYNSRFCGIARYYPPAFNSSHSNAAGTSSSNKDEAGFSLGWFGKVLAIVADSSWKPEKETHCYKLAITSKPEFRFHQADCKGDFKLAARYKPEDNPRARVDMRLGGTIGKGIFLTSCRLSLVHCRSWAAHGYLEAGMKMEKDKLGVSSYLRGSIFSVENWDDRIYVYERDIPGSFSVPAYYGKGWSLSYVAGCGWQGTRSSHRLNMKAAYTDYPWTSTKKPRGEIHLQYQLKFRYRRFHLDTPGTLHKDKGAGDTR